MIGVGWAVFQPLSMMLLFWFVFTYIMPVKMADYPAPLFFYTGLLFWTFFASALNYTIPCLVAHYNLITKIYFPKEILPFAGVALACVDLLFASLFFIALLFFYKIPLSFSALWAFPLILLLLLLTIAVSLFLSAVNVFFRDVQLASNFLIQLWFFATPVFYSVDKMSTNVKLFLFLNPMTFIIENLRRCLFEGRSTVLWQYAVMFIFVAVLLALSYRFFIVVERKFADVI